jgi:hypothetical protein
MPKREEVVKRFADFSGQLSTQCRTLSIGILALAWGLMTSKDSPLRGHETASPLVPSPISSVYKWNLIAISALVVLALIVDAAHYVAALGAERRCLVKMGEKGTEASYDLGSWAYILQEYAFWAKLSILGIASVWFIGLLTIWLYRNH